MSKTLKIKAPYIPLLAVYFAAGFAGISGVTSTLFFKDAVTLSAAQLVSLSIWTGLPWSIKMVFGALIDGVGRNRKLYIYLGNLLILAGTLGMIDHASTRVLFSHLGEYVGLLLTGLLATVGAVMADIVADTMAIEVVPEGPDRTKELGVVQVLSRLALMFGGLIAAALTGPLAKALAPATVYALTLISPALSTIATLLVRVEDTRTEHTLRSGILLGGVAYGIFCVVSGVWLGEYSQLAVFGVASVTLLLMLRPLLAEMPATAVRPFVAAMVAIFLFRVVPGIGPAGQWFYIEHLGFDANFLGMLSLVAAVTSLLALWALADRIVNHGIFQVMLTLIILATILSLPDILVYYGVHTMLGVSAKAVVLADTAMIGPLGQLSMIPLGVLIAKNAPAQSRAVYISLTASLMNLALLGGDLITERLNHIFVVSRTDFTELGGLMIASLTISTVLSAVGLTVLRYGGKSNG